MRIKLLVLILIGLITLITAFVGVNQPALHKQTMFSDEYHRFTEVEIPTSDINFTQVDTTPTQQIQVEQVQAKPKEQTKVQPQQPQQKQVTNVAPTTVAKQEPQKIVQKPVVKQDAPKVEESKPVTQKFTPPHELTEQEEIIAWNKWRSNLQNQVMKDAPTRAPLGTVFKFSFTVDKYGNMSNIKVWSENPNYTDLAVRVIKPVLSSYAHKPILNFPQGTKRVITNVTGGYQISTRTKYSSPSDYSDYERVKRYY